jgi:hypothetical protein
MGVVITVGSKSWDLPTFPTAGNTNPEGFKLCDCPQSKAIEKGCDMGACRNITNIDVKNTWPSVQQKLQQIYDEVDTEVNANRFLGLTPTLALIGNTYLKLKTDVEKHKRWLTRIKDKSKRERCCQDGNSIASAISVDEALLQSIDTMQVNLGTRLQAVERYEAAATAGIVDQIALQTALNNYNVEAAAAAEQIAESEEKEAESTTSKYAKYIGFGILGIVVVYFAIKMFKK